MRRAAVVAGVVMSLLLTPAAAAARSPRLGASDLVYLGGFRLPAPVSDRETFDYGGTALAYDPTRHGLFGVGHDWYQLTAEVTLPRPRRSALRRARFLQRFVDATDGKIDATGETGNKIGGELVYRGRLYGSVYVYYDASDSQVVSHWLRPSTSLTRGRARGLFQVGTL